MKNDSKSIQKAIDQLIFQLFDLDEDVINKLLKKYYDLQLT